MAAPKIYWAPIDTNTWTELDIAQYLILEGNGQFQLKESAFAIIPKNANFKIVCDKYEHVANTPAELFHTLLQTIGCFDTCTGGLGTGEYLRLTASLHIGLFTTVGPLSTDDPFDWGIREGDLLSSDPGNDGLRSSYRIPDNYQVVDSILCDVGNAEIAADVFEVTSVGDFEGGFIGANALSPTDLTDTYFHAFDGDGNPLPDPILVTNPVYNGGVSISAVAPMIDFPVWFKRLPTGTTIIDATLEVTLGGLLKYNFTEDIPDTSSVDDDRTYNVTISPALNSVGFTLIGKRYDGVWETIGSAIEVDSVSSGQSVLTGLKRKINVTAFAQLASDRPKKYEKLVLYPGFENSGGDAEQVSDFMSSFSGILWSLWNSWQTNNKYSGGTHFSSSFHWLVYDYLHLGAFTCQFKLPDGLLKSIRIQSSPLPVMA